MSIGSHYRSWKMRRRRSRAAKRGGRASLREFVYLDEVSVYSLIASRKGAVPSEVIENESALVRGDISSTVGANAGIAKGEVSSSLETQQSSGTQVVRKALVQSSFKELYELEGPNLPLRPDQSSGGPPQVASASALLELVRSDSAGWVISAQELRRGTLLEFDVELEAEGIFRMSAIMNAFFEIVDENPKLLGATSLPNLVDSYMTNQLVERLLVGLVPIRGRAVDYRSVVVDSTELIVHRALLEGIGDPDLAVNSLYVVGVTERELFWRDIRRVLFSHSRYSVLCRLGRDGPQSSWTPVKLVDVLKEVSSDLGAGIQEVGGYLDRQHEQGPDAVDDQAREAAMRRALSTYAEDIVRQHGHEPTAEDLAALDLESESQGGEHATREGRRATFAELSARLEARFGFQAEPLVAAQLRAAALDAAGFDLEGNLREPAGKEERPDSPAEAPRYLDSNIVAIYW